MKIIRGKKWFFLSDFAASKKRRKSDREFICHLVSSRCLLPVTFQNPHRTSTIICNNLTHSSSNPRDWMSIERSMDEYWTKYGAGIGRVLFGTFGHCIGWHIRLIWVKRYIIACIFHSGSKIIYYCLNKRLPLSREWRFAVGMTRKRGTSEAKIINELFMVIGDNSCLKKGDLKFKDLRLFGFQFTVIGLQSSANWKL